MAGVTLQGTVKCSISLAMELTGAEQEFFSHGTVRNVDLPFDASKVYCWLRQGSGAARPWDEILTLLMPQAGDQDFSLGLLPEFHSQVTFSALIMLDGGCLHSSYT